MNGKMEARMRGKGNHFFFFNVYILIQVKEAFFCVCVCLFNQNNGINKPSKSLHVLLQHIVSCRLHNLMRSKIETIQFNANCAAAPGVCAWVEQSFFAEDKEYVPSFVFIYVYLLAPMWLFSLFVSMTLIRRKATGLFVFFFKFSVQFDSQINCRWK